MNAGLHHGAAIPSDGFHLRIDIIAMASLVGDEHRVYDAELPQGFVPATGSYKTATVFGGKGTIFRDVNTGLEYKGSDGLLRASVFPLLVPQLTLGTIWGTEFSVRFMKTPQLSSGNLIPTNSTLWGVGLRHSISRYLGKPAVDISAGFFFSSFSLGDMMEFEGSAFHLQFSKALSMISPYLGIGYEVSRMHLHYNYIGQAGLSSKVVDIVIDGTNRFRVTSGVMIDLQAIQIYADANFGNVFHYSGGLSFGF